MIISGLISIFLAKLESPKAPQTGSWQSVQTSASPTREHLMAGKKGSRDGTVSVAVVAVS